MCYRMNILIQFPTQLHGKLVVFNISIPENWPNFNSKPEAKHCAPSRRQTSWQQCSKFECGAAPHSNSEQVYKLLDGQGITSVVWWMANICSHHCQLTINSISPHLAHILHPPLQILYQIQIHCHIWFSIMISRADQVQWQSSWAIWQLQAMLQGTSL